ncbi:MAG TPA: SAM-dependent methyltransferase [Candidatus Anaerobiospirillum stercoravium]|nr:SAM-dependent methyltransferase [Candidatus Anaerobiospirillum stercoravium]
MKPFHTSELYHLMHLDRDKSNAALFSACYESTLGSELRRSAGMHYTSITNIHKLIDPLFLDELQAEFAACLTIKTQKKRTAQLLEFQDKLSKLTFLDPACGAGNFLTETYLSLRRLENQVIRELHAHQGFLGLSELNPVKVTLDQFYGLELDECAVAAAHNALWIAGCQMMAETSAIIDHPIELEAQQNNANIVVGNALTTPWTEVVPADKLNYIIGNPPFSGARQMNADNKQDLRVALGPKWSPKGGDLDLVSGWFKKAHDLMALAPHIKSALVATNSICQGTAVANLWAPLQQGGTEIIFGHHSFLWQSEAPQQAAVYCVIVGMVNLACPNKGAKRIFTAQGEIRATHINAYLLDGPDVFISERKKPLCPVPEGGIGNKPIDDGNYLFTPEEKAEFLKLEPQAAPYFQRWFGGEELLNGKERYCLYLDECSEEELDALPEAKKRVDAVRQFRLNSKSIQTQKIADIPTRFHVANIPETPFLVIPKVSSGRRDYIPIAFMQPQDGLCSDLLNIFPNAKLWHFSILSSAVHMTWVKIVAGRINMNYRYSIKLVYNCFPWPQNLSSKQEQALSAAAQEILDARAAYPNATLAQLYNPETMPAALKQAHEANDLLVMQAYGFELNWSPEQVFGALLTRYQQLCAPAQAQAQAQGTRRHRTPQAQGAQATLALRRFGPEARAPRLCFAAVQRRSLSNKKT